MAAAERVEVVEADREREPKRSATSAPSTSSPSSAMSSSKPTSTGSSSPSRMPLSGVISSYDQARFGASVSIPSRRAATDRPTGREGRSAGCGTAGRARACERGPERVAGERARSVGVAERRRSGRATGASACWCRSRIGQSTNSSRCSVPRAPARLPEVAGVAATDRLEARALRNVDVPEEVVRDERRAGADGRARRRSLGSRGELVEELAGASRARAARRPDRRRARCRRCAVEPRPTTRSGRGCRRRGRRATRRARADDRSHRNAAGPSSATTRAPRLATSATSGSRPSSTSPATTG